MIWKKTWFSYVLWALYSGIVCLAFTLGIYQMLPGNLPAMAMVGIVCLFFLVFMAFYYLLRLPVSRACPEKQAGRGGLWAVILEVVLVVAGTALILALQSGFILSADPNHLAGVEYLKKAYVKDQVSVPVVWHGMEWFYLYVLRAIFWLVGNRGDAALFLQLGLWLAGSFLTYRGVRKNAGRLCGILCFLGLLAVPYDLHMTQVITPLWLQFFLMSLAFYFLNVLFFARSKEDGQKKQTGKRLAGYAGTLLLGAFLGMVIYGDLTGITLLLSGVSLLWALPVKNEKNPGHSLRSLHLFLLVAGSAAVFLGLLAEQASLFKMTFRQAAMMWWKVYGEQPLDKTVFLTQNTNVSILFLVLSACLYLGVYRFFAQKEQDGLGAMFLPFIGMAGIAATGLLHPVLGFPGLLFFLTVCAAVSVGKCLEREPVEQNSTEEEDVKEELETETETVTKEVTKEEITKEETAKEEAEKEVAAEIVPEEETQKPEKKVKLLDNPLPGPKKHVARVLDYDLKEEDLKNPKDWEYDIDTQDQDDYDLR